jgi:conjugal transfer pilus assembly protein TraK
VRAPNHNGLRERLAVTFVLAACAPAAFALQTLDAADGVAIEAILSTREPTRIRIEGARIVDVFGNIHSSGCMPPPMPPTVPGGGANAPAAPPAINPAGEIVIECDRDKGEIYVRPVGESIKPVNLFVSSPEATYTLVLRRADTPADTIVIRDQAAAQRRMAAAPRQVAAGTASHVRALKAMLAAMATDQTPSDIAVKEVGHSIALWREVRFQFERSYRGRGLIGERYWLQNVSDKSMTLTEPEFDRAANEGGELAAIAIERHNLRPGERTRVFVILKETRP